MYIIGHCQYSTAFWKYKKISVNSHIINKKLYCCAGRKLSIAGYGLYGLFSNRICFREDSNLTIRYWGLKKILLCFIMYKTMGGVCPCFCAPLRLQAHPIENREIQQFGFTLYVPEKPVSYATNIMTNPNSQDIDGSCFNEEKETVKQPYQRYGANH